MKHRIAVLLLFTTSLALGQTQTSPSTKLEAAINQVGGVTLRQTFGEQLFRGTTGGGAVTFEAVRVSTPGKSDVVQGVRVFVHPYQQTGRTAFIDFDDLPDVIKGLDYIANNNSGLDVKLQPELTFTSKSSLEIGISPASDQKESVFITAGLYTVFFDVNQLKAFRDTLTGFQASLK